MARDRAPQIGFTKVRTGGNRPETLLIYFLKRCLNWSFLVWTISRSPELAVYKCQNVFDRVFGAKKFKLNLVTIYSTFNFTGYSVSCFLVGTIWPVSLTGGPYPLGVYSALFRLREVSLSTSRQPLGSALISSASFHDLDQ
jgi:hypothetical protein